MGSRRVHQVSPHEMALGTETRSFRGTLVFCKLKMLKVLIYKYVR
jgi:hypothetical protein